MALWGAAQKMWQVLRMVRDCSYPLASKRYNNILQQVGTSFIDVPVVDAPLPPTLIIHSMEDDTRSSVNAI